MLGVENDGKNSAVRKHGNERNAALNVVSRKLSMRSEDLSINLDAPRISPRLTFLTSVEASTAPISAKNDEIVREKPDIPNEARVLETISTELLAATSSSNSVISNMGRGINVSFFNLL